MQFTGTHIAYLHTCHRKLWLFGRGIRMEHTSEAVAEGKFIGETSYSDRADKFTEIDIDGVKIDFYDARKKVIHEVKKTSSLETAHVAQVTYYIYRLERKGVEGVRGIIEYPRLKQRHEVLLTDDERRGIPQWERRCEEILAQEKCPDVLRSRICKSCSYHDFCYSSEI